MKPGRVNRFIKSFQLRMPPCSVSYRYRLKPAILFSYWQGGHRFASMTPQYCTGRVPAAGYVLTLKKRWYGIVEKIFLAEDKTQVRQIEFFNRSGSLIYRARFDEMQAVDNYQVPARLSISNGEGMVFQLEIQKYWADVPVSPSMFVLEPPN